MAKRLALSMEAAALFADLPLGAPEAQAMSAAPVLPTGPAHIAAGPGAPELKP